LDHKYNISTNDNFNIWYESQDPPFTDINVNSNVSFRWMDFNFVLNSPQANTVIKPINMYADYLIPPPELVSIENNVVRLRYKLHADIYLLDDGTKFYNVDRPWIRQYYQTMLDAELPSFCFPGVYKFYTPWIIDDNVIVHVEESPDSAFHIYSGNVKFNKVGPSSNIGHMFVEPNFIKFSFKKIGSHMEDDELGIIRRGASMFDMVFGTNDIMVERIKDFYDNYKVSPIQRR
jgi:hypothetical protein